MIFELLDEVLKSVSTRTPVLGVPGQTFVATSSWLEHTHSKILSASLAVLAMLYRHVMSGDSSMSVSSARVCLRCCFRNPQSRDNPARAAKRRATRHMNLMRISAAASCLMYLRLLVRPNRRLMNLC